MLGEHLKSSHRRKSLCLPSRVGNGRLHPKASWFAIFGTHLIESFMHKSFRSGLNNSRSIFQLWSTVPSWSRMYEPQPTESSLHLLIRSPCLMRFSMKHFQGSLVSCEAAMQRCCTDVQSGSQGG